jgi:hypothetical protein
MMSEEEQMEAALAASLGQPISADSPPPSQPSTTQATTPKPNITVPTTSDEQTMPIEAPSTTEKSSSLFSSIPASDVAEPTQSPQTTRIQKVAVPSSDVSIRQIQSGMYLLSSRV